MAHAGRPASRHGRYDAYLNEFEGQSAAANELPSQSVFSYDGTEDVRRPRENPTVHKKNSARSRTMSQGVIPSGPVVAVHMFDVPSDKDSSPPQTARLHRWPREMLDGSNGFPPPSPRPPSTPRSSRPGSARRRSQSGPRPGSSSKQRPPSSRRSSQDHDELLPPMATLRPQSSLGKYQVLPSISPTSDRLPIDLVNTSRSDGSEDQRGMEEMDYLTSRMAHQAMVETSRRGSKDSLQDRPSSRDSKEQKHPSEHSRTSVTQPGSESSTGTSMEMCTAFHHDSSVSSTTSPEPVNDRSHTSIAHYKMEEASKPFSEDQILLGIKIPTDGTRHKHYFNKREQLRCIVLFAEEVSGEDFSNHVLVLTTPRQCFDNLSQTIEAAGLQSKSVLHLEELD